MKSSIQSLIVRRLATVPYSDVARALGCDVSQVSRIASGERGVRVEQFDALFEVLGLAAEEVGGDAVTLPREKLRALQVLARDGLRFVGRDE